MLWPAGGAESTEYTFTTFEKEMPDKILLRDEFAVRYNADCQRGEKK